MIETLGQVDSKLARETTESEFFNGIRPKRTFVEDPLRAKS